MVTSLSHAVEVALLLLASYLLGCVLGYAAHRLVRRLETGRVATMPTSAPAPIASSSPARRLARAAARDEQEAVQPPAPSQRPAELSGPRGGKADDLHRIKGIGAKTESALNNLGIYHFSQIAAWTPANIEWLEGRIAIKGRIRREQWVEQATLLATDPAGS